jgi:hypothetical protein
MFAQQQCFTDVILMILLYKYRDGQPWLRGDQQAVASLSSSLRVLLFTPAAKLCGETRMTSAYDDMPGRCDAPRKSVCL